MLVRVTHLLKGKIVEKKSLFMTILPYASPALVPRNLSRKKFFPEKIFSPFCVKLYE
jgi:hypothetical protein